MYNSLLLTQLTYLQLLYIISTNGTHFTLLSFEVVHYFGLSSPRFVVLFRKIWVLVICFIILSITLIIWYLYYQEKEKIEGNIEYPWKYAIYLGVFSYKILKHKERWKKWFSSLLQTFFSFLSFLQKIFIFTHERSSFLHVRDLKRSFSSIQFVRGQEISFRQR